MKDPNEILLKEAERRLRDIFYACRRHAQANEGNYPTRLPLNLVSSLKAGEGNFTYFKGATDVGANRLVAVSPLISEKRVGLFSFGNIERMSEEECRVWLQINEENAKGDMSTEDVLERRARLLGEPWSED